MSWLEGARAGIFSASDTRGRLTSHVAGLDEKLSNRAGQQRLRAVDIGNEKSNEIF